MGEREKLIERLARARVYHKKALRWLIEVSRIKDILCPQFVYEDEDNIDVKIINIIHKAVDEAKIDVIRTRQAIDRIKDKLDGQNI